MNNAMMPIIAANNAIAASSLNADSGGDITVGGLIICVIAALVLCWLTWTLFEWFMEWRDKSLVDILLEQWECLRGLKIRSTKKDGDS